MGGVCEGGRRGEGEGEGRGRKKKEKEEEKGVRGRQHDGAAAMDGPHGRQRGNPAMHTRLCGGDAAQDVATQWWEGGEGERRGGREEEEGARERGKGGGGAERGEAGEMEGGGREGRRGDGKTMVELTHSCSQTLQNGVLLACMLSSFRVSAISSSRAAWFASLFAAIASGPTVDGLVRGATGLPAGLLTSASLLRGLS